MVFLLGSENHEWSKNISHSSWKYLNLNDKFSRTVNSFFFFFCRQPVKCILFPWMQLLGKNISLETNCRNPHLWQGHNSIVYSLCLTAVTWCRFHRNELQKSPFLTMDTTADCILFAWKQSLGVNVSTETNCTNSCYWHGHNNSNKILFTWM